MTGGREHAIISASFCIVLAAGLPSCRVTPVSSCMFLDLFDCCSEWQCNQFLVAIRRAPFRRLSAIWTTLLLEHHNLPWQYSQMASTVLRIHRVASMHSCFQVQILVSQRALFQDLALRKRKKPILSGILCYPKIDGHRARFVCEPFHSHSLPSLLPPPMFCVPFALAGARDQANEATQELRSPTEA